MRSALLIGAAAFVALIVDKPVYVTSSCKQVFNFMGLSEGPKPVFWITEDLSGECNTSRLLQVVMADSTPFVIYTELKESGNWDWFKKGVEYLQMKPALRLNNQDGIWTVERETWRIKTPSHDQNLSEAFDKHIRAGGSNGITWNKDRVSDGVILPQVEDAKTNLVYYYRAGLYINYEIDKVYYFPNFGYLLIFTRQSKLAIGLDTMHGFVILKIIN